MILRRITQHVKDQNWFAVALDFFIVVVGVFVGLQVQEWAGEQGRRKIEKSYTMRLHDEVIDVQAVRTPLSVYRHKVRDDLIAATSLLFGDADRALSAEQCESIALSYTVSNPTDDLASLLELQSSGGLSLFQNTSVLSALRTFLLTRARARDSRAGVAVSIIELSRGHPQLIRTSSPSVFSATPPIFAEYQCDVEGMRASPAFLNDYELNQANFAFHVRDIGLVDQSLADLHRVLDQVLNITHEEAN